MKKAPELQTIAWINTERPLTLAEFSGRVVVIHAFQMLCPACTYQAIPQTERLHKRFAKDKDVVVIGLHTVFEHHNVMTPEALSVFAKENRLSFPIGVDSPSDSSGLPKTMQEYEMQGTPTVILIDKRGRVRAQHFGVIDDFDLGFAIGMLAAEEIAKE